MFFKNKIITEFKTSNTDDILKIQKILFSYLIRQITLVKSIILFSLKNIILLKNDRKIRKYK